MVGTPRLSTSIPNLDGRLEYAAYWVPHDRRLGAVHLRVQRWTRIGANFV